MTHWRVRHSEMHPVTYVISDHVKYFDSFATAQQFSETTWCGPPEEVTIFDMIQENYT